MWCLYADKLINKKKLYIAHYGVVAYYVFRVMILCVLP